MEDLQFFNFKYTAGFFFCKSEQKWCKSETSHFYLFCSPTASRMKWFSFKCHVAGLKQNLICYSWILKHFPTAIQVSIAEMLQALHSSSTSGCSWNKPYPQKVNTCFCKGKDVVSTTTSVISKLWRFCSNLLDHSKWPSLTKILK